MIDHIKDNNRMNSKPKLMRICKRILIVVAVIALFYSMLYLAESRQGVKRAVTRYGFKDRDYVICNYTKTTGYQWIAVEGSYEGFNKHYCRLDTSSIYPSLAFDYDFMRGTNNRFVFYFTEIREYHDAFLDEMVTEYIIDDWDILFPVTHGNIRGMLFKGIFRFTFPSWWIIESDLGNWDGILRSNISEFKFGTDPWSPKI